MSDDRITNQLLTEIRDLLAAREQQYQDHLANCERTYANQLELNRQYAWRWALVQWTALFFIIYAAVALATSNAP